MSWGMTVKKFSCRACATEVGVARPPVPAIATTEARMSISPRVSWSIPVTRAEAAEPSNRSPARAPAEATCKERYHELIETCPLVLSALSERPMEV